MEDTNAVIAVYSSHSAAEDAVKELQRAGFDMEGLSLRRARRRLLQRG
jgi:hypothetical protein